MSSQRLGWTIAALLSLLANGCFSSGRTRPLSPTELEELKTATADLEEKVVKARAKLQVLEAERQLVEKAVPRGAPDGKAPGFASAGAVLGLIRDQLKKSADSRREGLKSLAKKADEDCNAAMKQLREASMASVEARARSYEVKAQLVAEGNAAGWGDVFDVGLLGIVVWGGFLLLAGVLLGAQVQRVWVRQLRRSGLRAAVVLACLTAASAAFASDQGELSRHRDKLRDELQTLNQKAEKERKDVADSRENLLLAWKKLLAAFAEKEGGLVGDELAQWEVEAYEQLQAALVNTRAAELAAERGLELAEQAKRDEEQLPGLSTRSHRLNLARGVVKLLACVVLAGLALIPVSLARRKVAGRLAREARQCPRCLADGKLEDKKSALQDPRYPERNYRYCQECHHEFPASHQRLPRLCFPTVGAVKSGKTHWLVTVYDSIKTSKTILAGSLENAPSLAEGEFDGLVKMVLESYHDPAATIEDLPAPLTFHVRDDDDLGGNQVLLNMFDFSGEVMDKRIDTNELRCRALLMDGFVLFLDPTQILPRQGSSVGLDAQIRQLARFRDEMREMRGLDPGVRLKVPLAVCVPKIDLLVNRNPIGGQARKWISKLRESATRPPSLRTLRWRSDHLVEILPILFPGWDVRKALRDSFGDCFLFFPLTPVSLEDAELGIGDLRSRTISPFGVLEPMLWLLYMRGYNVLPDAGSRGGR